MSNPQISETFNKTESLPINTANKTDNFNSNNENTESSLIIANTTNSNNNQEINILASNLNSNFF